MLLFQKVEEVAHQYSDARRVIGEFLLAEKDRLEECSLQESADRTFTSKASLVRFAKTVGYSGWKSFIKDFLAECHYEATHYSDIDPNFPFAEGEGLRDIVYKLCNLQVESLLDTADQMDIKQLERAVDLLCGARQIAVLGQPPNSYVANLFKRKMLSIGRPILLYEGGDLGLLAHSLGAQDCAILISYTGNNEKRIPLNMIPLLKEHAVPILAITGLGDNLLRQQADCVLSMSSRERIYSKISTFATEESIGYILNVLFAGCFARNYQANLQYKIDASKLTEKRFSSYSDIREEKSSIDT